MFSVFSAYTNGMWQLALKSFIKGFYFKGTRFCPMIDCPSKRLELRLIERCQTPTQNRSQHNLFLALINIDLQRRGEIVNKISKSEKRVSFTNCYFVLRKSECLH